MAELDQGQVVAPGWYADGIGPPVISYEAALARGPRFLRIAAGRSTTARGVALAWISRRSTLAVVKGTPGFMSSLVTSALCARGRRLIVLEFIHRPDSRSKLRAQAREVVRRLWEAPALRHAMAFGHVLTERERGEYSRAYRIEEDRFIRVRWPLCRGGTTESPAISEHGTSVFSSGRAGSDWETLFAASKDATWSLTIVCSGLDAERVAWLNSGGRARVLCEIGRHEHDQLLRASDVYVMAMRERGVSAGHVRLMSAVENGVPVVASDIEALREYVVDTKTALLVPPGDHAALRSTIDSLLDDPGRRAVLRDSAIQRAREWTYRHYFDRLRSLITTL